MEAVEVVEDGRRRIAVACLIVRLMIIEVVKIITIILLTPMLLQEVSSVPDI